MPFKNDYIENEKISEETYNAADTAITRVVAIYRAARKGNLNRQAAKMLWQKFFVPLRRRLQQLPTSRDAYDTFACRQIRTLARLLRKLDRGDFGIAQKMFNLFMKDHWALDALSRQTQLVLHLPLDRTIIYKLRKHPASWSAWTRARDSKATRQDYQMMQTALRAEWKRIHLFAAPIEMEQFIWHRVNNAKSDNATTPNQSLQPTASHCTIQLSHD